MRLRANGHHPQAAMNHFRYIWIWFKKLSRFGQIGLIVFAIHAAVILMLLISHAAIDSETLRKPIAIRTILLPKEAIKAPLTANGEQKTAPKKTHQPQTEQPKRAAQPNQTPTKKSTQSSSQPSKKAVPPPRKETKQAVQPPQKETKKTTQPRVEPKTKKEEKKDHPVSKIDSDLLQKIVEDLEAIASSTKISRQSNFTVPLPSSIEIRPEVQTSFDRPKYGEIVSAILLHSLDLPEFGQVIVAVEIDANGSVTQCEILDARSRKNGEFLKKRLQELTFPCFNEFGLSENHLNFTITFNNVENR